MARITHGQYVYDIDPTTGRWQIMSGDQCLASQEGLSTFDPRPVTRHGKFGHLIMHITDKCNFACRHCFANSTPDQGEMDLAVAREIITAALQQTPYRTLTILFEGGEPLLAFPLLESLVTEFTENHFGKRIRWQLQSNGSALNQHMVDFIIKYGIDVSVCLDEYTNDVGTLRVFLDGGHTTDRVLEALRHLRQRSINVHVLGVLHRHNVDQATHLIDQLHAMGIRHFALNWLMPAGRARDQESGTGCSLYESWSCTPEQALQATQQITGHLLTMNRSNPMDRTIERNIAFLFQALLTGRQLFMCSLSPCGAGKESITFTPSGRAYPCVWFYNQRHSVVPESGDIHTDSFEDILSRAGNSLACARTAAAIPACSTCPWVFYCGTGCPATTPADANGLNQPGAICEIAKQVIPWALSLIPEIDDLSLLYEATK